jgi:signal transduction histidine kinase
MKIIANAELTESYVRKLDRGKYLAVAALVLLVLTGVLGFVFHVAQNIPDLVSNIMYPLTSGVGAGWAFLTAYRAYRGPVRLGLNHARAWLLVGMGLLANCLGGLLYTILERSGQTILIPSFSDIGFTLFYPLIFIGLFLMPTALRFRLRMALDAVIATLSILGVSWFFFISKVYITGVESKVSIPELIMSLSYPFWDVLLILAIILLIYRRTNSLFLPSLVLFGTGMLLNIWADTGYAYTQAIDTYHSVNFLIDPFWYFGFLLVGLAGLFQYATISHRAYQEGISSASDQISSGQPVSSHTSAARWRLAQNTLIYLPLAILLLLTFYSEYQENLLDHSVPLFLTVLAALVGILIAIRSLVATQENERLLTELAFAKAEQEEIATEQAILYMELSKTHQRLQDLDKLKDQFMVTASHELRTPLTSIQGYLELLVEYGYAATSEQQRDFLLKAQRGSEELALLLNNVMDASRLEIDAGIRPAYLQPVQVQEAVESIVSLLEPQLIHDQRKVELLISPSLAVRADPARLRQVLLNLSVNAMKYSPEGSPITFSAHQINAPVPAVILSVIDQGSGVPPQEQENLFQRFVRLERDLNSATRGSGLGLYISRRLIEAMGGKIWVESSGVPGEGSSFHIQLLAAS